MLLELEDKPARSGKKRKRNALSEVSARQPPRAQARATNWSQGASEFDDWGRDIRRSACIRTCPDERQPCILMYMLYILLVDIGFACYNILINKKKHYYLINQFVFSK